jgi:dGTP triphosphohydrolase
MIENIVENMKSLVNDLKDSINLDILDIKEAKHEELLKRNDKKHFIIDEITKLKSELNQELIKKIQEGTDVNIYRDLVDSLEKDLKELYELNKKLASIVMPVQQLYKDLVSEISAANGGRIFDIKA